MSVSDPVLNSELPLPLLHRGKVRDVYSAGSDALLMVASDRVSAFDVVLPQPIPRKGEVLTQMTAWWMKQLEEVLDHHLLSVNADTIEGVMPQLGPTRASWEGRSMLVRRTEPILVECVVRGYLSGSAWKEYQESGTLAGEALPPGLQESEKLDPPIFSPSTKAQQGHDENISEDQVRGLLGDHLTAQLRQMSFHIYGFGAQVAQEAGIILADTKFEFGMEAGGRLLLIDEVLTPDSSRFWPQEHYAVGRGQPSLDKQPVRDWLETVPDWNKQAPGPDLTPEVVEASTSRYLEIFRRLTGVNLSDYQAPDFVEDF